MDTHREIVKIIERLDRIVSLLEGQANDRGAHGRNSKAATTNSVSRVSNGAGKLATAKLVAAYCDAYKERHGSFPVVDGKAAGIARNLLRTLSLERAQDLVQAYLQMDTPWFRTRGWALDTLAQNLNVVALSLANGTKEPGDREYWTKVFGGGETNDKGRISSTNREAEGNVYRPTLSSGESCAPVEGVSIVRRF